MPQCLCVRSRTGKVHGNNICWKLCKFCKRPSLRAKKWELSRINPKKSSQDITIKLTKLRKEFSIEVRTRKKEPRANQEAHTLPDEVGVRRAGKQRGSCWRWQGCRQWNNFQINTEFLFQQNCLQVPDTLGIRSWRQKKMVFESSWIHTEILSKRTKPNKILHEWRGHGRLSEEMHL